MAAYYNEIDKAAAEWLRGLIKAGVIADGEVDTRSIVDVRPGDVRGFTQCHFFAGIGGWSLALRLAGWPDDRPVWTGSCPCQPYSLAGARAGGNDPRDLWPAWFELIRECRPAIVLGEQVESAIAHGWLDRLCDDLEGQDYALGAACLPVAGVGGFNIRQRLWFIGELADAVAGRLGSGERRQRGATGKPHAGGCVDAGGVADTDGRHAEHGGVQRGREYGLRAERAEARILADAERAERGPLGVGGFDERHGRDCGRAQAHGEPRACGEVCALADADRDGARRHARKLSGDESEHDQRAADRDHASLDRGAVGELADATGREFGIDRRAPGHAGHVDERESAGELGDAQEHRHEGRSIRTDRDAPDGATEASFWSDAEWIPCRDGKSRPVKPGIFPLVDGVSGGRVALGRAVQPPAAALSAEEEAAHVFSRTAVLRGAGNAISPQVAAAFIGAYLEVVEAR